MQASAHFAGIGGLFVLKRVRASATLSFTVQKLSRWTWHAADIVPTPVIDHPPALTRRPSLTKEGSFSLNRGREP